jgi:hypothetical protein
MGPASGSNRVNRGGNWGNNAENARCANRNNNGPSNANNNVGFRLASTASESRKQSHPPDPRSATAETNKTGARP